MALPIGAELLNEAALRNGALHLPFAVESMGGLSESAQQLIGEIHHSAGSHTWRDADTIGNHLVDAIAIAVQRCTGMALSECVHRERRAVLGSAE